ncbi:hypothetical protein M758_8G017000 [Ceratodon purpureus]|nr:hypothetical protein M758_8G017000 [Ceratodon purpureus]
MDVQIQRFTKKLVIAILALSQKPKEKGWSLLREKIEKFQGNSTSMNKTALINEKKRGTPENKKKCTNIYFEGERTRPWDHEHWRVFGNPLVRPPSQNCR